MWETTLAMIAIMWQFEVKDGRVKFEVPKFLVYAIVRIQLEK